jgi:hypothetical protein
MHMYLVPTLNIIHALLLFLRVLSVSRVACGRTTLGGGDERDINPIHRMLKSDLMRISLSR